MNSAAELAEATKAAHTTNQTIIRPVFPSAATDPAIRAGGGREEYLGTPAVVNTGILTKGLSGSERR
jgi:hypothetical protein